jgi:hypothetical protein
VPCPYTRKAIALPVELIWSYSGKPHGLERSRCKKFIKERMEFAKAQPSGWQDYKFMNSVTKKVGYKKFYFERYND